MDSDTFLYVYMYMNTYIYICIYIYTYICIHQIRFFSDTLFGCKLCQWEIWIQKHHDWNPPIWSWQLALFQKCISNIHQNSELAYFLASHGPQAVSSSKNNQETIPYQTLQFLLANFFKPGYQCRITGLNGSFCVVASHLRDFNFEELYISYGCVVGPAKRLWANAATVVSVNISDSARPPSWYVLRLPVCLSLERAGIAY